MSAAEAQGKKFTAYQAEPSVGTKAREIWDLFQASRGKVIEFDAAAHTKNISALRNYYGLDLRRIKKHRWCLVGEWLHDGTYVDYVAEPEKET